MLLYSASFGRGQFSFGRWECTAVQVINLQTKFPVIGLEIPVPGNIFPDSLSRELLNKCLQCSFFLRQDRLQMPQKRKIPY
jgi:hypothetical protein